MNEPIPAKPSDSGSTNGDANHNQSRIQDLMAENERLRAELAQARLERDDYLKALYKLAPEYMFTAEEIEDMMTNGVDGREVLAMVEAMVEESP